MGDGEDTASLDRGRGFANFFDERGFLADLPPLDMPAQTPFL